MVQVGRTSHSVCPPANERVIRGRKTYTAINVYDAASNRTTLQAPDSSTNTMYTDEALPGRNSVKCQLIERTSKNEF
jgi:hypothetical protein